jgi:hypothetical protein
VPDVAAPRTVQKDGGINAVHKDDPPVVAGVVFEFGMDSGNFSLTIPLFLIINLPKALAN